jgi:hypothetical protein
MRRLALFIALAAPMAAFAQTTPATPPSGNAQQFVARFDAANTTHDGHLTLAQAQAANMRGIVKHFSEIDTANAGYVTLQEIQAWYQAHPHHHQPQGAQPQS